MEEINFASYSVPQKPGAEKWVILQFTDRGNHILVSYCDGLGNKDSSDDEVRICYDLPVKVLYVPTKIDSYLKTIYDHHPLGVYDTEFRRKVPLSLYLQESQLAERWVHALFTDGKKILQQLFPNILQQGDFEVAFNNLSTGKPRPFELPLEIEYTGHKTGAYLDKLKKASFLNEVVKSYGLRIGPAFDGHPATKADILICDSEQAKRWIPTENSANSAGHLIIIDSETIPAYWRAFLKHGTDCMVIQSSETSDTAEFIKRFIYAITHNLPLMEAVAEARKISLYDGTITLFLSPVSNQSLRIEDALDQFQKKVESYASTLNPGKYTDFLKKMPDQFGGLADQLRKAYLQHTNLNTYFKNVQMYTTEFKRESQGLEPMAYQQKDFTEKEPDLKSLKMALNEITSNPDFFRLIREKQERKVSITMDVLNENLQYAAISSQQSLRPGIACKLNLSIGQPSQNNLITGEIPSIDPLLPDPENEKGHELEVVLFAKDFTLRSEAIQRIQLPSLGASDIASFYLAAPAKEGDAFLRVAIFHKNHLLQAFLLQSKVSTTDHWYELKNTTVTLDLSNTSKFTNLDGLQERNLYIGLNDNGNGTHSLFIKGTEVKEIHGLNETLIGKAQQRFADFMNKAYFKGNDIRFPVNKLPPNIEEFNEEVRKLARLGREYHSHIFQNGGQKLQDMLRRVRSECNLNLQIARHESAHSFPWAMLYDYVLPIEFTGDLPYPVCMGEKLDASLYPHAKRDDSFGCPHNPELSTFCIEGFWGVRHRLEQLMASSKPSDASTEITAGDHTPILFCNNLTDSYGLKLEADLKWRYSRLVIVDHNCSLLDLLWNAQSRPANLIVVGHLDTERAIGEPPPPRILTFPRKSWPGPGTIPANKWLFHELLDETIYNKNTWRDPPLPLVFLISCYNTKMNVDSLNSMVVDFRSAGASAVIGTECDITSDMAAKFINDIMHYLYEDKKSLGEAIRLFNLKLFQSQNPLAFAFTCFGNNDLTVN